MKSFICCPGSLGDSGLDTMAGRLEPSETLPQQNGQAESTALDWDSGLVKVCLVSTVLGHFFLEPKYLFLFPVGFRGPAADPSLTHCCLVPQLDSVVCGS